MRIDLGTVDLGTGKGLSPAALQLTIEADLYEPNGWLLGGPSTGPSSPARARTAALELVLPVSSEQASFSATFTDAAVNGAGGAQVTLADPAGRQLLGAVIRARVPGAAPAGQFQALLALFDGLGLLLHDANGQVSDVAADTLTALCESPRAFLGARLPGLLATNPGLLGFSPVPGAPGAPVQWQRSLGGSWDLVLNSQPWGLRRSTGAGGIPLGPTLSLSFDLAATVPGMAVTVEAGWLSAPAPCAWYREPAARASW